MVGGGVDDAHEVAQGVVEELRPLLVGGGVAVGVEAEGGTCRRVVCSLRLSLVRGVAWWCRWCCSASCPWRPGSRRRSGRRVR